MNNYLFPKEDMSFWKIQNNENIIHIKWSHNPFEDYKTLAYQYYNCGYKTCENIISSGHNNIKSDKWFFAGVFLLRQSIELGIKTLLCKVCNTKQCISSAFENCKHNLILLFKKYCELTNENYLNNDETTWLNSYLDSLTKIDTGSDSFRFPFEDDFVSSYKNKFLDNQKVICNLILAFNLIKKCIEETSYSEYDKYTKVLKPDFFIFTSHGIGNCYLCNDLVLNRIGYKEKITGYSEVINFIYNNKEITIKEKIYPLIFLLRNDLELCMKQLYYTVKNIGNKQKHIKEKSHNLEKKLWNKMKPTIKQYAEISNSDLGILDVVEKMITEINNIDKKCAVFRYPTEYNLDYPFDERTIDIKNVYEYFMSLINFFQNCDAMIKDIIENSDK